MKRILAIVLSIAILVMAMPFSVFATTPSVATDTWDGTTVEPTATDADGNVIINTAEELAWVALVAGDTTAGKTYKVADDQVFDMGGFEGITLDSTADDVVAATKTEQYWFNDTPVFKGIFDGNGAVIYNICGKPGVAYGGLFPIIRGTDATIKNVVVKASAFYGYHNAAAIVGLADHQFTVDIIKCSVENCYMSDNNNQNAACQRAAGVFVARSGNCNVNISNCFGAGNILSAQGIEGGFIASSGDYSKVGLTVSDSILIGTSAFPTAKATAQGKDILNKLTYTNVYTDVDCETAGVTTLTTDKMQGDAAKANMALAWNTDWLVGEEGKYPSINYGEPIKDPYVWDGTFSEPTTTDDEGNIIINTVQEMAWVALRGDTATEGKNYKVADGIEYFDMNGAVGITADSTAEEVKNATKTDKIWRYETETDGKGKVGAFRGNFDGNGVTIYNIYSAGYGYGALFPYVYNESTIKNVIVKASFLSGYHYSAGIVGVGELQKTINISKCAVENCYITDNGNTNAACKRAAAQFVAGTGNSNINISNCFAANNTLSAAGYEAGFVGASGDYIPTGISITNSISIGMYPYSTAKIGVLGKGLTEQLTVENVYSDVECDVAGFTTLTTDKMQGEAAKSNMALAWNTDWLVGAEGEYPVINFGEPIKDPYVWDGTFSEPTTTDAEGNIIINTVQEMAWVALRGGDATANKNYKVADGIKYFNMNGMSGITLDSTAEQVNAATKDKTYLWLNDSNYFMGNFDGNGLTVYNINAAVAGSSAYTGLFTVVKPENDAKAITIKNVTVAASHFEGYHYTGGIVGFAQNQSANTGCVNVDSCAVKNCYFYDTVRLHNSASGLVIGQVNHNSGNVSNCLAINNISDAAKINGGIVGTSSDYISTQTISNCVVIGSLPYSTVVEGSGGKIGTKIQNATVTNVYTDQVSTVDSYTTLTNEQMQGAVASVAMETLDDSVWFFNTTTYPELRVFHNIVDGKCNECGLEVAGDPCVGGHTLVAVEGYDATNFTNGLLAHNKCSICDKTFIDGVEKSADELVIPMLAKTWNGTFVEPTTTDENGNIIINTPEELAWVALRGGAATEGKNYIVAKDSVFNLNGMAGITPFSTVADVKAATKNDTCKWQFATDYTTDSPFSGNFDGNGLTVYNLYTGNNRGFGGLFPALMNQDGGSISIKNVTLLSSHIGGYHWAGGIVGYSNSASSNAKLTIENTAVKNCFIYDNDNTNSVCQRTTGVLVGQLLHAATTINNCLVVDNELSAQGIIGGLFGNTSNYGGANVVKNVISIGTTVQSIMVNYPINSKEVTYTNVYTNQIASADGITTLTIDQMQGSAATENMNLNWGINWTVGAEGEYPSIITDNSFYDEWDGTFVEPTTTDAEGNIIINSAEELAWVALRGGDATIGKNYKVADGIKLFNMNGKVGITANSSVTDVKAAENTGTVWSLDIDNINAAPFQGNFDGNGLTVYNIVTAKQGYSGLFPVVKPASGGSLTVKNIAVVASDIRAYHNAGAVVGVANAPDTSTSFILENSIVKNCFISDGNDSNESTQRTAATHVGALSHNTTTINNCLAIDNELSAQGAVGGFFSNTSNYGGAISVSNSVSIGTNAAVTVLIDGSDKYGSKIAAAIYTNVYTDQSTDVSGITTLTVDEMSGENALTNTTLDWSGWFATTGLPELRAFHSVTSTDNGDGTHTNVCTDCDINGLSTPHVYKNGLCDVCSVECVHSAGDAVIENAVEATCKAEGSYESVVYCSVCGEEISRDTITVEKLDHTPAEAVQENRVEATCKAEGSYESVVYCSVCGEEISRDTVTIEIDKNAHQYDDTNDTDCNICGETRPLYVSGDANKDGKVNVKDAALIIQFVNGWNNIVIDEIASDVNNDGKVNSKDYALVIQYANGWNVELI